MKKNIHSFITKLKTLPNGMISGGFGTIKGGVSFNPSNNESCTNSVTCTSGDNTFGCTNSGNCTGSSNIGAKACSNTGTCYV